MTGRASEHGAEGLQHIINLHKQNDTEKLHSHTGFTCYNHFYTDGVSLLILNKVFYSRPPSIRIELNQFMNLWYSPKAEEAAETKYCFASCRLTCRTQFSQNSRLGSREVLRIQNLYSEDILARDMKKNNNNQL
ncbi:hypothetical protein An18g03390 [Aspergillus niger]|uniref:Uncharacterized protein n=2 Tax=Aspergillus niger TaxID=5061 RepID=A2RAJ8_ASPNC|nr:hypothetical protein An18g03390 [Aspergillus niger]CAK48724.1 hypothetical protein An18g03390 [Aspergillus niger]